MATLLRYEGVGAGRRLRFRPERTGPDDIDDVALDLIWDEIGEKEGVDDGGVSA